MQKKKIKIQTAAADKILCFVVRPDLISLQSKFILSSPSGPMNV